jgi:hypothetical protein
MALMEPQISIKIRLLKFFYVSVTGACSSKGIFAGATNSVNQTNKARGTLFLMEGSEPFEKTLRRLPEC